MILLLCSLALAGEVRAVHTGDTVESLATDLGDIGLASRIRELNGLASDAQPEIGQLLELPPAEEPGENRPGLVLSLTGRGSLREPGGPSRPLVVGQRLELGSTVCVEEDSFATLRLAPALQSHLHDDISLQPGTCVVLSASFARPGRRASLVQLERGELEVARAPGDLGRVVVRAARAITAGRAGGYRVALEPDATRHEALSEPTSVISEGVEVLLQPGEALRTPFEEAPGPRSTLLRSSGLLHPADGSELRRAEFAWSPVDRALAYRIQLSSSEDFHRIVSQTELPEPRWSPELLFLPYRVPALWWRVSPVDRSGFVGLPSEPRVMRYPPGVGP